MITDKDREELKELTNQIRKSNQTMQWFDYGWDDCAEIITRYVEKKNAESAEQARKEAADRAVEWVMKKLVPGVLADIIVQDLLYSILFDNGKNDDHIPDTGKKLAIAVKALEYVVSKSMPSNVFESQYSRLQEACTKAHEALKEIQG